MTSAQVVRPRTLQVSVTQAPVVVQKLCSLKPYQEFWLPQFCWRPASQRHSLRMTTSIIKNRNSYPLWNGSLKRDIQGFKPGMTESEAKQRLSDCEASGHKIFCPVASKDERFELSLTEHTRPLLVKEVTYVFPAGGATLETMAKNVMVQFEVGNSRQCLPPPQGISQCSQWQLEDGSYMRLGVDAYRRNMFRIC